MAKNTPIIPRKNRVARNAADKPRKPAATANRLRTSLAAVRRELRKETSRRRVVEKRLLETTQDYSRLLAQSKRMQLQAKRLARRILSAQETERKEISRDLHDEVAQTLAGINVQLASLKEASAIGSAELRKRIARTQRLVTRSVQIVHRYAKELRPALLDDLGLIPALRAYIRDLPGCGGLGVRFEAFPEVEAMDNRRRTVIYRVVQEALTNICRHAHARKATVKIKTEGDTVIAEVHDDGKSFQVANLLSANPSGRIGLIGMRERVEMVGGLFSIESTPGKGTLVRAVIPFRGKLRSQKT